MNGWKITAIFFALMTIGGIMEINNIYFDSEPVSTKGAAIAIGSGIVALFGFGAFKAWKEGNKSRN